MRILVMWVCTLLRELMRRRLAGVLALVLLVLVLWWSVSLLLAMLEAAMCRGTVLLVVVWLLMTVLL